MKLYNEYRNAVDSLGVIEKAYFTTFNLSPEFFENYILPPLINADIPDNEYSLEDLNALLESSSIDLKVFYDANMISLNERKRTITRFYPVLMKSGGVFHPKVIYIESKEKAVLFVGSGNLTLSGWGRNIEAFDIVKFDKNDTLYSQVEKLFSDIEYETGLRKKRSHEKVDVDDYINLVYSFEKSKSSTILNHLQLNNRLTVWSPYFSSDLDTLLGKVKEEFTSLKEINIFPDLVNPEKIRIPKLPGGKHNIKFYDNEKPDDIKMNHSKVWVSDSHIAIGSYNFTEEALYGKNFEAALVRKVGNIDIKYSEIHPLVMNSKELEEESIENIDRFSMVFELTTNWKLRSFQIKEICGNEKIDLNTLTVVLPGNIETSYSNLNTLTSLQKEKVFKALIKNKIFKVKYSDKIVFEGLILEDQTKGFRETVKPETLEDVFLSFLDEKDPTGSGRIKNRVIIFDENSEDLTGHQSSHKPVSLNYYNLYTGFYNLYQKFETVKNDTVGLYRFCFHSSNSLVSMINIIEENKRSDLFTYLLINELNQLIEMVNTLLKKKDKLEKVLNVEISLKKEDKNFIKSMQW